MTLLRRLRLFVRTMSYLRGAQLVHYAYRRSLLRGSKPRRAASRPCVRESATVSFPVASEKVLDRLCLAASDEEPAQNFDWRTSDMWRPLRIQIHYFDYLNDPERARAWKSAIVADWIRHHPPGKGDAWTAYPVSLRIVNWIKCFTRIEAADVDPSSIESLYGHALWLENNLELHILANHYLKNAKALLFAGMYFTGRDADRWRDVGLQIFMAQMREQFLSDGGHYERSPMYHKISLEDILDVYNYLGTGARHEAAETLETLRSYAVRALEFMSAIRLPDGTLPLFNDSCEGVGPSLVELYAYAQTVLGYEPPRATAGLTVRALSPSGYYVIRKGADALVIDCAPLGPDYQPGHGHCDALSYELSLRGEPVVVDSGAFDYEPNARRIYARSTAAHNTIQIDSVEQSEIWDVFRVARRAKPLGASLTLLGPRQATFSGAHDGYERSPTKTTHRRTVRYENGRWHFEDTLDGAGLHLVESRVHLHPALDARRTNDEISISATDGSPIAILRFTPDVEVRLERGPYYPRFGLAQPRHVVVMTRHASLPTTMSYEIAPYEASESKR